MSRSKTIAAISLLITTAACVSSEVDPRCTINAPNSRYRAKLAQTVNGSDLWQTYFDLMLPVKEGATRSETRPGAASPWTSGSISPKRSAGWRAAAWRCGSRP